MSKERLVQTYPVSMMSTPSVPSQSGHFGSHVVPVEEHALVPSVFWNIAFTCWLATIFILYSRFFDLVLRGFYIPKAVLSLMCLFFLVSGRPLFFVRSTVGKIMLGFVFWVTFTLIFSIWKSGSIPFYTQLLQSLFFFAVAAGLPNTISNVRKSLYALAFSGVLAAMMSFHWGVDMGGRLALRDGSYLDPNYYAMGLAAVVPFLWEMATSAQSKVMRVFAWLSMPSLFLVLAKTGSRGSMLGFGVMLLLLLIISPVKTKIVLIILSALGFGLAIATVPSYVRERYLTFFSVDSISNQQQVDSGNQDLDRLKGDVGSAEERKRLLQESINLTLEHPLVGVGPGCFQAAVYDEAKAKGIKHNVWLMTHNSYTQISSENGFPGLILFLCLIGASFKNLSVVLKGAKPGGESPDRATYAVAKSLLLSLAVVSVCIFFLAVAYDFTIYVWAGLTVGLRRVYEQKRNRIADSAALRELEEAPKATAFSPAFARAQDRLTPRPTPTVSGRPVRFNRFR
jgi:O-antigen ligase